jgi:formylglycine-generating enzyme required for sulfatase activity
LVVVIASVLASVSLNATETFEQSESLLASLVGSGDHAMCPAGMAHITATEDDFCIDLYENSFGEACPYRDPKSALETNVNLERALCKTQSVPAATPATHTTYAQAQIMCAQRDARLPTAEEWYEAALGTPDGVPCRIDGGKELTGTSECRSVFGAHDMVGNVWEWVLGTVTDGSYEGFPLPAEGYITAVTAEGLPTATAQEPSELLGGDYLWQSVSGTYVALRGGFYGSGSDAGIHTLHAMVEPTLDSQAIGFRCMIEL